MSAQGFWSGRRAAVAAEAQAEADAELARAEAASRAQLEEKSDEDILAELNLPDPDSLEQGDDFAAFLSKAVPERLRRRALRRLWRSNPVLACVDGLNDYDGDFTNAATDAIDLKTAYQVGRGMLYHVEKSAEIAVAEAEPPEDSQEVHLARAETPEEDAETGPEATVPEAETEDSPRPVPRRMKFTYQAEIA